MAHIEPFHDDTSSIIDEYDEFMQVIAKLSRMMKMMMGMILILVTMRTSGLATTLVT